MCGTDISYGRYCPTCATKLKKELSSALIATEIGEVPKKSGKMRYMSLDERKLSNKDTRKR